MTTTLIDSHCNKDFLKSKVIEIELQKFKKKLIPPVILNMNEKFMLIILAILINFIDLDLDPISCVVI